jgi:3-isopropylmalate dehydrogenase
MTTTIACLAGDGVGPELMGAATRVLDRVAKLHQLSLDERHLPFAGEAVTRSGHPLPAATRAAYRDSDAILVAAPHEPAFAGVKADLQLAWRAVRVQVAPGTDLIVTGPVDEWANATAIGRAFSCAASRRARITCVGWSPAWRAAVAAERAARDGLTVDEAQLGETLVRLRDRPGSIDVVVTEAHLVDAIVDAAASLAGSQATVAHAWLPDDGPGVFAPATSEPDEHAGFGVADPRGMLLATSLMLAEGLKRQAASRTLERAVAAAGRWSGGTRDTRAFTDAVISALPDARTDVEHFDEVWR